MITKKIEADDALDLVVMQWIQALQNVHFRCISHHHIDTDTGDEYMDVYDPVTDRCITVWLSPSRFGNEALKLARQVLASPNSIR